MRNCERSCNGEFQGNLMMNQGDLNGEPWESQSCGVPYLWTFGARYWYHCYVTIVVRSGVLIGDLVWECGTGNELNGSTGEPNGGLWESLSYGVHYWWTCELAIGELLQELYSNRLSIDVPAEIVLLPAEIALFPFIDVILTLHLFCFPFDLFHPLHQNQKSRCSI